MRWIIALFLLLPHMAAAQVNIEKLRSDGTEEGLQGSMGFSTAFTHGNIQFVDFGANAHQEYKTGLHSVFWVMGSRFAAKRTQADLLADPDVSLWDKDAHFSNLMLQHLRYNYALSDTIWLEVFSQYEFNEFLLLDRRILGGSGLRFALVRGSGGAVFFGTAAMLENEKLNQEGIANDEVASRSDWRSSSYISATYAPKDSFSWTTTIYFQPRFLALSDYRMVAESGLAFSLSKHVAFTADARLRHDTNPPKTAADSPKLLQTDIAIKNGIKVSW